MSWPHNKCELVQSVVRSRTVQPFQLHYSIHFLGLNTVHGLALFYLYILSLQGRSRSLVGATFNLVLPRLEYQPFVLPEQT